MVEEGCELLGYGLCLLATLSYMKTVLRRMTRKREGGALFIRNNILTLTPEIRLIGWIQNFKGCLRVAF